MNTIWRMLGLAVLGAGLLLALLRWRRKPQWEQMFHPKTVASPPPPDPADLPPDVPEQQSRSLPAGDAPSPAPDKDMPDMPPPPPEPEPLELYTRGPNPQAQRLWLALQREAYRQRGEGFREDWAFPLHAARHNLGAPLTRGQRTQIGDQAYVFQPFASAILFSVVPKWGEVYDVYHVAAEAGSSPSFAADLHKAAYTAVGQEYHAEWASHQRATQDRLGVALAPATRIGIGEHEYSLQVFASDTLYVQVPNWNDLHYLSTTPPGPLADALWRETYKALGVPFNRERAAHQLAVAEKLGTPLSDLYPMDFEGQPLQVQVFAREVVFSEGGNVFSRQHTLDRPPTFAASAAASAPKFTPPDEFTASDATSSKRPTFGMLPIAGNPQITQLYGYTKWAAGGGRQYYGATQGQHPGIDFWVPVGTPQLAIAHGLVVYAGASNTAPFGGAPPMIVIVRYGNVYGLYGHSSAVRVRKGQFVHPGEVVSLSGDYGGPHLHFELRPVPASVLGNTDPQQPGVNAGTAMNPLDYFSPELQRYFEQAWHKLGGDQHFCQGGLRDQGVIRFGAAVDTRPCRG